MKLKKVTAAFIAVSLCACTLSVNAFAVDEAVKTAVVALDESANVSVNFTNADTREYATQGDNVLNVLVDDTWSKIAEKVITNDGNIGPNEGADIRVKDITVTYDYTYTAAEDDEIADPADAGISLYVFGNGGSADGTSTDLQFYPNDDGGYNNAVEHFDSLTGTNKTVTFSALGGNAGNIEDIWFLGLGIGGNGKIGDSLTLTVKKVEFSVEYEKGYACIFKDYNEYINADALKLTYDLSKVDECGHGSHIADDGVNYNPNNEYCPWATICIYCVSASGVWSEEFYEVIEPGADKPTNTVTVMMKDIFAVIGTPTAGEQLVFAGGPSAVPTNVEFIDEFKLPDIDLNTGSIVSATIKEAEEWTPNGGKPLGEPDLNLGQIDLIENALETKLEGYKALQINYTVDNPSVLSAINVVLHGWEDDSVGWDTTFYAVSSSGTITIDLTKYQDKTYHNIYVYPVAPAAAKIGDGFAPGFTVTSAKLLTEYSGTFSQTIPEVTPIKPIEEKPEPSRPSTPSTSTPSGSQNTSSSTNSATEKAVEEINNAAAGTTVDISLKGSTVADKDIFIAIAGKDIDIKVTVSGGVTIEINGKDVENAKNVDLGVKMNSNAIKEERINEIAENKDTVQFSLKHNGDFGFKAKFNLPVNKKYNGKYANIYWDNKGTLEFVGSSIVSNGTVGYATGHASDYVMVFDDHAYGEDVSSASGVYADSEDAENTSYKIIAVFALIVGISAVTTKKFIVKSK